MVKTETVEKLGGKVTEFSIHISRKVTDGNYGSFEVSIGETVSVGSEEDAVELEREYYAFLKGKVLKAAESFTPVVEKPVAKLVPAPQADGMLDDTPGVYNAQGDKLCEKHNVYASEKSNDKGTWYSHRIDGVSDEAPNKEKWCNVK